MVGFFKEEAGLRGSMRDGPLKSCPDLDSLKTKMQRRRAGLMEVKNKMVKIKSQGAAVLSLFGGGGCNGMARSSSAALDDNLCTRCMYPPHCTRNYRNGKVSLT